MPFQLFNQDCLSWLKEREAESIHAIVTDPPFGMREYTKAEVEKLRSGRGGVWRIPPSMGGSKRAPLPRFTVLTDDDLEEMRDFFVAWGTEVNRVLLPGAHVFIATNPLVSYVVYSALLEAGLEKRGEVIRLVRTLRGGDRPKGADKVYREVSVIPRAAYEPWGLFRKPVTGTLSENLKKYKTGGLRRPTVDQPFTDVIPSERTSKAERAIGKHPSLKPQRFMREVVRASLPLGEGVVLDPFMGGGSTIAAAEALGYKSIGLEIDAEYFANAKKAIPQLAKLKIEPKWPCILPEDDDPGQQCKLDFDKSD